MQPRSLSRMPLMTGKSPCGVLYGALRDAAYKLRGEAEKERSLHQQEGIWEVEEE